MAVPNRFTSGFTQDQRWQPLGNMGQPNPFFYNTFFAEFNAVPSGVLFSGGLNATRTVAQVAGDGGVLQIGTGVTTPTVNDYAYVQLGGTAAIGSFLLIPPTPTVQGKRTYFFTRLAATALTTSGVIAGLTAAATPFNATGGTNSTVDGIYFYKAPGASNNLVLLNVSGGVVQNTVTIPVAAYTSFWTNSSFVDLGFEYTANGEIGIFVGLNTVGQQTQSGSSATNAAGTPQVRQPVAFQRNVGTPGGIPLTVSSALLTPTLGVSTGTAAAANTTLNVDFVLAARER